MNKGFNAAMQRAVKSLRSQDAATATQNIQEALSGAQAQAAQRGPKPELGHSELLRMRKPLGETLRVLRMKAPPAPPIHIPPGAQYLRRTFSCGAGSRAYTLYIPATRPAGWRGLLLMLHGCTQNSDDFAMGTGMNAVAEQNGLVIAYAEQAKSANAMSCWNWFDPLHQSRGRGEPAILAAMAEVLRNEFAISTSHVFAAGLSAGGAMAATLAETYPDVFAAVGIHSGLPYRSAHDVPSALAAMRRPAYSTRPASLANGPRRVRTIVFHGSADHTVHPVNGEEILGPARVRDGRHRAEHGSAGGRRYARMIVPDDAGPTAAEYWLIEGAAHAWSGGNAHGSFTDALGPDASAEMVRFFLEVR